MLRRSGGQDMIVRSATTSFTQQDNSPIHAAPAGRAGRVLLAGLAALGLLIGTAGTATQAHAASDPHTVMKNGRGVTIAAVNPSSQAPNQDFKVTTHGYTGKVVLTLRVAVQADDDTGQGCLGNSKPGAGVKCFTRTYHRVTVKAGTHILSVPLSLKTDAGGCIFVYVVSISSAKTKTRQTYEASIQTYVTEEGPLNDTVTVKR